MLTIKQRLLLDSLKVLYNKIQRQDTILSEEYCKKLVKITVDEIYRVNPDSKQINIYGHNSRTYDIPFRKLEKFLDKDFFEENKYIVLQTDSGRRIYKIFSIKEYAKDYEYMVVDLTGKDFVNHLNILKKDSINSREVEYDENSNLLVLQTCSYGKKNTYYIISAIEIEE